MNIPTQIMMNSCVISLLSQTHLP